MGFDQISHSFLSGLLVEELTFGVSCTQRSLEATENISHRISRGDATSPSPIAKSEDPPGEEFVEASNDVAWHLQQPRSKSKSNPAANTIEVTAA